MKNKKDEVFAYCISERLKAIRHERGLSLDKTAALTGVSKAMLGQIERCESSPTIAKLWKIATGLQVSFSSFLTAESCHSIEEGEGSIYDPNMHVKTLFSYDKSKQFEAFDITLTALHQQQSTAHQKGVSEHIHVLEGRLGIFTKGQWHIIEAGQQWVFDADQPHRYEDKVGKTRFLTIIHYPNASKNEN
ncbi:MAG TPA: XRE family transcriptional regulator [Alteromonas australica]|uniref:XRE family transcriptional regulator n=1 Tax=Alteromonas australica TaxID=589873 RepID=A0A349TTZ2_9ALTE|nr:XRE family transcriptional regulator [Alteromonas australica]MAF72216.1 XRE family transcriptional regulator [Alteromonas sp.]MBU34841.1 XRE family transcriptional regulator [Alteromonas sp.]HAU27507.1 XRE family transcriptional regulator [Alteromonas australica]HAW76786.1 XRE family transcriptional regulator [Alteromonas australica]HBU52694.1 XRE family transcriptional regulator [Alteromonas australica]|tara:strand:- start:523 stop:1092 length:570 start_codon:yes stop_codon:yes gene_type:complete